MRSILEEETAADRKTNGPQKIELQHINVKVLLEGGENLDPIIPIFHGWIQNRILPELLIDVADYRHVHHGPGIVLIGHEADYSIDNTNGRLGLRYNRKAQLTGTNEEKLTQAARAAFVAAKYLQEDTRLSNKLYFNGHDIELFVNDRLVAPTNNDTRCALDLDLRRFANKLLNRSEYSLTYEADARRLFGAAIHFKQVFSVDDLIQNLNS
ncbi:MAG TPA: hypothetical protein VFA90_18805 [Terriglobales bacterium]|nr:hypothetical protein [Terriglobales bacterium]